MKKTLYLFMACVLAFCMLAGCKPTNEPEQTTSQQTQAPTQPITQEKAKEPTLPQTEEATQALTEGEVPRETQLEQDAESQPEQQEMHFGGVWLPSKAVSIASGQETPFAEAFGSSYAQYGGALTIYEDGYFEIGMGAYSSEEEHKGTYTSRGSIINVTYLNNATDEFNYIVDEDSREYIIAKVGEYEVYFSR